MDHTYQRPLQLPAGYSVLSAEEMTYTEGGALSINITPEQVMAFGSDDAMQKKWKTFCRKFQIIRCFLKTFMTEHCPHIREICNKVFTFIRPFAEKIHTIRVTKVMDTRTFSGMRDTRLFQIPSEIFIYIT